MKKIKFDAKQEYEFIENFKLLQGAFNKKGVDKVHTQCHNIMPCHVLNSTCAGCPGGPPRQGQVPGQL